MSECKEAEVEARTNGPMTPAVFPAFTLSVSSPRPISLAPVHQVSGEITGDAYLACAPPFMLSPSK